MSQQSQSHESAQPKDAAPRRPLPGLPSAKRRQERVAMHQTSSREAASPLVPPPRRTAPKGNTCREKAKGMSLYHPAIGTEATSPCTRCAKRAKTGCCMVAKDPILQDTVKCGHCVMGKNVCSFNGRRPGIVYAPAVMQKLREKDAKARATNLKKQRTKAARKARELAKQQEGGLEGEVKQEEEVQQQPPRRQRQRQPRPVVPAPDVASHHGGAARAYPDEATAAANRAWYESSVNPAFA
ncbi:hypothetical protein F4780DRAFT_170009 [Xylariomycetidae sp. FL0641]|nr:hypothetical protein F4780DRAFT_170009 [Xylariomycetidae sp. FL0641]